MAATYEVIDSDAAFEEVVEQLVDEPRYALDTEFHRERTYFPKLALIQLAWRGGLALVDPLVVDVTPLRRVLEGPGVAVLHASDQDLEVLALACGVVPSNLFDTQIAAGFVGMSSPSLAALYQHVLGLTVPKSDRLSDWLARPLQPNQLEYAASDVAHLLEVQHRLAEELEGRGRLQWVLDECEEIRRRARGVRDPSLAWRRIREARQLKGRSREIARAVAAWREMRAIELDVPSRFVIPDLAIVAIAQRPPTDTHGLFKIRGLDDRHLGGGQAGALLEVIEEARQRPLGPPEPAAERELDRDLRPAVSLVSAWVSQMARQLEIETALLATRADLEAFLRGDEDARLAHGWRASLVGEPIRQLVRGDAALAFDGNGALVLEERSHRPVG
ncbi:ribonuclease D [Rhabdothermincola sp.]|uniref:ribonuclease D n=1 Tax=Rhabdothermincola sp. TaxID=2820405 RepID=UPI002FE26BBB